MSPEKEKQLLERFPNLFRQRYWGIRRSCMAWGFNVADGWFDIVWDLATKLDRINKRGDNSCPCGKGHGRKSHTNGGGNASHCQKCGPPRGWRGCSGYRADPYDIMAVQVKEKFGGLRFYLGGAGSATEEVRKLVGAAEELSYRTCEECGRPGRQGGKSWLRVSCYDCRVLRDGKEYADELQAAYAKKDAEGKELSTEELANEAAKR